MWFDSGMRRNAHLEKIWEKSEKWWGGGGGKNWLYEQSDGEMEVDRSRLIWELLAKSSLEHASEVWWSGRKAMCKNLEKFKRSVDLATTEVSPYQHHVLD